MDINAVLNDALKVLKEGGVILYPTDTVWGIGCDATNEKAVAKVFALKRRSGAKSLVLLASDLDMVCRFVKQIPPMAIDLVEVNDSPMTLIYPGATGLAPSTIAEDGSVGIRIPLNDFCVQMVRRFGKPVVSTSANVSGDPAPKCFSEISEVIRDGVDHIVEPSLERDSTGKPSQIISISLDGEVKVIRP